MPAAAPYLRRLRVDVVKKFMTAASSHCGELETSMTTDAPFSTSARPSPVSVLTPELGDAETASWPCSRNFVMTFDPISPLPPMTTIFIVITSFQIIRLGLRPGQSNLISLSYLIRGGDGGVGDNLFSPLCVNGR